MPGNDPFERFGEVLAEAADAQIPNHNAMVVSTVSAAGQPSSRVVLLKGFDHDGFVFYTNLESRKGRNLAENNRVALNFHWRALEKQIVILGRAELVRDDEADAYFATRPRGSQLGAWASRQSRRLTSRAQLLKEVAKVEARHLGRDVPRPPHWSGYRVVPHWFEFWVSGTFRLHDRTVFERVGDGWQRYKLNP